MLNNGQKKPIIYSTTCQITCFTTYLTTCFLLALLLEEAK